ncbi:12886_t:CDS:2, partial [Acaulospora colombiana]
YLLKEQVRMSSQKYTGRVRAMDRIQETIRKTSDFLHDIHRIMVLVREYCPAEEPMGRRAGEALRHLSSLLRRQATTKTNS